MSDLLPIFPLPNVVLFPNVFLPLHIFEARYREMVADALKSDRLIGMVLLRPGWQRDYEGRPAVLTMGRDVTSRKMLEAQLVQADRLAALGTISRSAGLVVRVAPRSSSELSS